ALNSVLDLLAGLRDPERGDPWHQGQDFSSIAPYTIEEAYEVADAIERQNMQDLCSELGDLLFQVIYHAQLAAEKGFFTFTDVVAALESKLRERSRSNVQGTSGGWQKDKMRKSLSGTATSASLLDHIPSSQPALSRAQKLQVNAATAGFDWNNAGDVLKKIAEEFTELGAEITGTREPSRITHELGDILFALVNLARHLRVDAEGALRSANHRFEQRFRYIEDRLRESNLTPDQVTLEELEKLWQEAKKK
ncbi:MAG: nucleoside triphosphate pyrophosphohydrolase, partial [Gammaproteobacteria bacterium]